MTDKDWGALVGVVFAVLFVVAMIWSSGKEEEAYTLDVTMPNGSVKECTFIGYGKYRTLLECERE